jgi:HEAT repeat protein
MRARVWLAPLVVGAVAAAYFAAFVRYGINLEDEGTILYQVARTAAGQLPYVDFATGYTPGMFYLNATLLQVFGHSVLPLRWCLVGVNATAMALLFVLARPYAGTALAAVAALGYAAFLPCFVGEFASFNVPYPAWYAALAWLAAQVAFDRHLTRGRAGALFWAGLWAGVAFSFKPNSGVLAVLACGLALALVAAGEADRDRGPARLLLWLGGFALLVLFSFDVASVEFPMVLGAPLALILGRLFWARRPAAHAMRLWPAIGLVAVGASLPTLPWLVYFLARLGVARFLRDVLLFGSGAERIYATPYPVPLGFPDAWALLVALGVLAAAVSGRAVVRGRMRAGPVLGAGLVATVAAAVLASRWMRMPEGIARSIVWQAHDVAFFLAPPLGIAAVVTLLRRLRGPGGLGSRGARPLGALVFALCMYVQIYPRIDSMHLILALPSMLVVAAAGARRLAVTWATALRIPARVPVTLAVGVAAGLTLVAVLPNLAGPHARPQVMLPAPAAPVQVEMARSSDLLALGAVVDYLRTRLAPNEPLFGFPATGLVGYALGHPSPTPHDYFFPGRPDHGDEAKIVRALVRDRPRYLVTLNRRLGFFYEAPGYYFILRRHVRQHYVLAARFGRYDVLRHRDRRPQEPAVIAPDRAWKGKDAAWVRARLADPDRELRRGAVLAFLDAAGDAAGVGPLAASWLPDETGHIMLVRDLGESADERALPFLLETLDSPARRLGTEAARALTLMALRAQADRFLFARGKAPFAFEAWARRHLDRAQAREWVHDRGQRLRVGIFATAALAAAGDTGAVPVLEETIWQERRAAMRVASAEALVTLGRSDYLCTLVDLLGEQKHEMQDTMPSFLIAAARKHPVEAAGCLERGLANPVPLGREMSAWIGGAVPLPALAPALRRALDDRDEAVRGAAGWALERVTVAGRVS